MKTRPKNMISASALRLLALALVSTAFLGSPPAAQATAYYWDTNGTSTGSGAATGTWGTDTFWSTSSTGVLTPSVVTTTTADSLTFSASTNGTTGTITVSGTQNASTVTLNQNGLTFSGGTINIATSGGLLMNSATSAQIDSALTLSGSINFNGGSAQTLTLGGGETGAQTVVGGSTAKALVSTLRLNGSGATNYQFSQYNIGNASAGTAGAVLNTGAKISYSAGTTLGIGNAAVGLLTINGGSLGGDTNTSVAVGRTSGTGRLIINSGSVSIGTGKIFEIDKGDTAGGSGVVDMNGGTLTVVGNMNVGQAQTGTGGTATLNITNGTVTAGTINFGNASTAGSGSLAMTGGTLYAGSGGLVKLGTGTFTSSITLSGGVVGAAAAWSSSMDMALGTTNGSVTFKAADASSAAFNITLSGALSGAGGLIKTGAGALFLTGTKSFTGDVHLNAGTLSSSSAFIDDSASLYLLTGGTLNLAFSGTDSISKLFIDGVQQNAGTYDAANLAAFITGAGSLNVLTAIPEPGAYAALLGVIGLGGAVFGRRRR
ncbi:MAG: autotransporter-associated beta strand repeat-containing protein [Opitutaceae bacterium]|jgi:autotransporter-associated beta strand protein